MEVARHVGVAQQLNGWSMAANEHGRSSAPFASRQWAASSRELFLSHFCQKNTGAFVETNCLWAQLTTIDKLIMQMRNTGKGRKNRCKATLRNNAGKHADASKRTCEPTAGVTQQIHHSFSFFFFFPLLCSWGQMRAPWWWWSLLRARPAGHSLCHRLLASWLTRTVPRSLTVYLCSYHVWGSKPLFASGHQIKKGRCCFSYLNWLIRCEPLRFFFQGKRKIIAAKP